MRICYQIDIFVVVIVLTSVLDSFDMHLHTFVTVDLSRVSYYVISFIMLRMSFIRGKGTYFTR